MWSYEKWCHFSWNYKEKPPPLQGHSITTGEVKMMLSLWNFLFVSSHGAFSVMRGFLQHFNGRLMLLLLSSLSLWLEWDFPDYFQRYCSVFNGALKSVGAQEQFLVKELVSCLSVVLGLTFLFRFCYELLTTLIQSAVWRCHDTVYFKVAIRSALEVPVYQHLVGRQSVC